MGTVVEKVFSALAGRPVQAGDAVTIRPDHVLLNDVISVGAFENLKTVAEPDNIVVVVDHGIPIPSGQIPGTDVTLGCHERALVKFAQAHGIRYEFGNTIAYQKIAKEAKKEQLVIGLGRNISTLGISGTLGISVSTETMSKLLETGKVELTVPGTYRLALKGKLTGSATVRDAAFSLVAAVDSIKTAGKVIEFSGEAFDAMTDSEKFQLLNLAADMGAVSAVAGCGCGEPDAEFELGKVVPVIVKAGSMKNVVPVSEFDGKVPFVNGFIGGCGAGYIEDLRIAAEIFKGKKVGYGTRIIVAPVDNATYYQAMDEGLIKIFLDAGAYFMNAGCLGCTGVGAGRLSKDEVAFGTGSFNATGCMGFKNSEVYLASTATVAKGCIAGYISKELEG